MLNWTALFASVVVAIVGTLLFWANPWRSVNRVVFSCSLHITLWLGFLHLAFTLRPGLVWLRWTCAISAWVPMHFWLVEENISKELGRARMQWVRKGWGWFLISAFCSALCFTNAFIPAYSTSAARVYAWGYYTYIVGVFGLYGVVLFHGFRRSRVLTGGRRLEMQVWAVGGCAMTLSILATMVLNALTRDIIYVRLQPLFVLIFYAGMAFAITTNRIFDANQILRVVAHRLVLLFLAAGIGYASYWMIAPFLPVPVTLLAITVVEFVFFPAIKNRFDLIFQFYPQATAVRKAAFDAAQRELNPEDLEASFLRILQGWGRTDYALMLAVSKGGSDGTEGGKSREGLAVESLRKFRWVTPERLARQRPTPEGLMLGDFLAERRLGIAVLSESSVLSMIVGVGVPASRRPFTYPQVTQLVELSSIMENAFERAHLATKIQRTEQLITVGLLGASVAHEIRNPLVSIKAIIQMLPTRYHEAAFRDKFFQLISDEVVRIDRLTEQLLDLASPRAYTPRLMELHPTLQKALGLVGAKAGERRDRILTELEASPDRVYTDPAAVAQVALNLCLNAIQAMEDKNGDGWIKITTRNKGDLIELAVSDNGPGITPEMRVRLFQAFQSTKSSGFGLGLTICRDILAGLHASIALDPAVPGQGATFRVVFPCRPLLS